MFINRPVPTANTCATVYRSCAGADAAFKSFDAIFCYENDARKVDGEDDRIMSVMSNRSWFDCVRSDNIKEKAVYNNYDGTYGPETNNLMETDPRRIAVGSLVVKDKDACSKHRVLELCILLVQLLCGELKHLLNFIHYYLVAPASKRLPTTGLVHKVTYQAGNHTRISAGPGAYTFRHDDMATARRAHTPHHNPCPCTQAHTHTCTTLQREPVKPGGQAQEYPAAVLLSATHLPPLRQG
uniref:SFRICE_003248 n=1 Tax=Spodoptera frugiperda TaxID=7108 RepID=A0A2H1VC26_SPOFR